MELSVIKKKLFIKLFVANNVIESLIRFIKKSVFAMFLNKTCVFLFRQWQTMFSDKKRVKTTVSSSKHPIGLYSAAKGTRNEETIIIYTYIYIIV
jgi:hypothetical protein